jgi:putative multiple sugar transport system substrate-binding protein
MVEALLKAASRKSTTPTTYDNGVKVVPSYLLEPVSVDASNWEEILIGSATTRWTRSSKAVPS